MEMMEYVNQMVDTWGHMVPNVVFWAIVGIAALLTAAFYLFPKHVKKVTNKYDVDYDRVDGLVRLLGELAVRLAVAKKGVESTHDLARIKDVAKIIDTLYPTSSSIRLSELVKQLERGTRQMRVTNGSVPEYDNTIHEIRNALLSEVVKVGDKVKDNEHDPLVNTADLSRWLNNSADAVMRQRP